MYPRRQSVVEKNLEIKSGVHFSVPSFRKDANKNVMRLLDAAKTVFAEKGFEATVEDVANKAEVGVGTVYRRFGNKQQLTAAVITDIFLQIYENQLRISKSDYSADQKIRLIFENFTNISRHHGKIHDMGLAMINSGELGDEMQKSLLFHLKEILREVIIQGQKEGIFREGNPEIFVILLFNMVNPQVVFQLKSWVPTEEIPKYISDMILKGLSKNSLS
jgi:AcrR family transcriptional regulator